MKKKFILVDLADDSGNDDGVIAELYMTPEDAYDKNELLYEKGSSRRWINPMKRDSPIITHL